VFNNEQLEAHVFWKFLRVCFHDRNFFDPGGCPWGMKQADNSDLLYQNNRIHLLSAITVNIRIQKF